MTPIQNASGEASQIRPGDRGENPQHGTQTGQPNTEGDNRDGTWRNRPWVGANFLEPMTGKHYKTRAKQYANRLG